MRGLRLLLPLDGGGPGLHRPAALAKAYRFVGDPRDAETEERLHDLADDPHGIYDCTHCFSCIDACPRAWRRWTRSCACAAKPAKRASRNPNNGHNHEEAFVKIIEKKGTLDEALLLQESYAPGAKGKLKPTQGGDQGNDRLDPDGDPRHRNRQDALAAEADPRDIHPKLPAVPRTRSRRSQHAEEHLPGVQPLHQGEEERLAVETEEPDEPLAARRGRQVSDEQIKVAYWPGCVSRGFTTELHGSMALVAERLGIELVTLDRANCCGAGVIAEHNQELADTSPGRSRCGG